MPFSYSRDDIQGVKEFVKTKRFPLNKKTNRDKERYARKWNNISIEKDGKFYQNGKQIIFKEDVTSFLRLYYDDPKQGFQGRDKLFEKIKREYIGVSRNEISKFLNNYETQQVHKKVPKKITSRSISVKKPLVRWQLDLVIINKPEKKVLFVMIDIFTKYAWIKVLNNKTGKNIANTLDIILRDESPNIPTLIHTDNGSEFINKDFKKILKKYDIKHTTGLPYTPTHQAVVERLNKTIKSMLARYQSQYNNTYINQKIIDDLTYNYNNSMHSTTKRIPSQIHPQVSVKRLGRRNRRVVKNQIDDTETKAIKRNIDKNTSNNITNTNNSFKPIKKGQWVRVDKERLKLVKKNPFKKSYLRNWSFEIFEVISVSKPSRRAIHPVYTIREENGSKPINRRFYRHELLLIDKDKLVRELGESGTVVDKIVDKRKKGRRIQYLVHHLNTPKSQDDWYFKSELEGAKDAIKEYEDKRRK